MLNVPDYVLEEEEETVHMDSEVSDEEEGELWCSDFEVPLFTWETFIDLIVLHLGRISREEWDTLAFDRVELCTIHTLIDMYYELIDSVTMEVFEEIEPQYHAANTPVTMNDSEAPERERNLSYVTEQDIEASLGDSLNQCFAEVMGLSQKKSEFSEKVREMVASEVARKINCKLAAQSTSIDENEFVTERPLIVEMVRLTCKLLHENLLRKNSSETSEEEYLDSAFSSSSYQDEMWELPSISSGYSDPPSSLLPMPPTSIQEKFSKGEKTFLAVLLAKLLDRITESTKTSILALDFDGILKNIIETLDETKFPSTCGNLHLSIFDTLCQEFGSSKLLQAAVMSEDPAFAEAFSRELKAQLEKPSKKQSFFSKVKNFFTRKTSKVAPAVWTI